MAEAKDIPVNPACDVRRYYAAAFKLICTGRESLHQGALEYGYKMLVAGIAFFAIVPRGLELRFNRVLITGRSARKVCLIQKRGRDPRIAPLSDCGEQLLA